MYRYTRGLLLVDRSNRAFFFLSLLLNPFSNHKVNNKTLIFTIIIQRFTMPGKGFLFTAWACAYSTVTLAIPGFSKTTAKVLVNEEVVPVKIDEERGGVQADLVFDVQRARIISGPPDLACYFSANTQTSDSNLDWSSTTSTSGNDFVSETFYSNQSIIEPNFQNAKHLFCFMPEKGSDFKNTIAIYYEFKINKRVQRLMFPNIVLPSDVAQERKSIVEVAGVGPGNSFGIPLGNRVTIVKAAIVHAPNPNYKCKGFNRKDEMLAEFSISDPLFTQTTGIEGIICFDAALSNF